MIINIVIKINQSQQTFNLEHDENKTIGTNNFFDSFSQNCGRNRKHTEFKSTKWTVYHRNVTEKIDGNEKLGKSLRKENNLHTTNASLQKYKKFS